jgi:ornithine cyclodeaminase/alanine dehydrogenase-like protein (mu-crystallin family)
MKRAPLLHLSAADVRKALPMAEAIAAMRDAFGQLSRGQVTLPPRQHIEASAEHGTALVMACHSAALKRFSLKCITLFSQNRLKGLPLIHALVILTDGATGEHLAVLDGASLTALRTGAASGLATDLLARPEAAVAAVFGAGIQARTQLQEVCCEQRDGWFDTRRENPARCGKSTG